MAATNTADGHARPARNLRGRVADSTAELQAQLDALKPGDTLMLTGSYWHSGVLVIRVSNVRIDGNGATLNTTNDPTSSVRIKADEVTVNAPGLFDDRIPGGPGP